MHLVVNGERRAFPDTNSTDHAAAFTLDALIAALGLPRERVAVEVNGAIVKRADRAAHALRDGDVLEIVTLVGGG